MAFFAKINEDKIVTEVLVTDDHMINKGQDWLIENFGGTWIETHVDPHVGAKAAQIGSTYDEKRSVFIPSSPFESWIFDENTWSWDPPVSYPSDGLTYAWNEELVDWEQVQTEPTE